MTITLSGLSKEVFFAKLAKLIGQLEARKQLPYYDTANPPIPTIGIGFNIRDDNMRDMVFDEMGIPEANKSSLKTILKDESITDKKTLQSKLKEKLGSAFVMTDAQIAAVYKIIATEKVDEANAKNNINYSYELIALTSLHFNGLYGSGLQRALNLPNPNDARAEAWYQIRYAHADQLHKRRYAEAAVFGLFDPSPWQNKDEYLAVYRMFTNYRLVPLSSNLNMIDYDKKYEILLGKANADLKAAGFSQKALPLLDELQSAATFLIKEYLTDGFGSKDFTPLNIQVASDRSQTLHGEDTFDRTGSNNDLLIGRDGGDDVMFGEAGDDHLLGLAGSDNLNGEAGNDVVNGGDGKDYLSGGAGNDYLLGGKDDDVLVGDDDNNGDWLFGNDGYDTYYAGSGDWVDDSDFNGKMYFNGTKLTGGTSAQGYVSIQQRKDGWPGGFPWTATSGAPHYSNSIYEGDGGFYIFCEYIGLTFIKDGEAMFIKGAIKTQLKGLGIDLKDVSKPPMLNEVVYTPNHLPYNPDLQPYENPDDSDSPQSDHDYSLSNSQQNLTLTGTLPINGTGNELDNILRGNTAGNVLDGEQGADTMTGGCGNDIYFIDNTGDIVVESESEGIDTVKSSISYTLGAYFENLTLLSTAAINGTGNDLDNLLTGNNADNILDGAQGADIMAGGRGNDTFVIDNENDIVIEYQGEGIDTVRSSISFSLDTDFENLTLTGDFAIDGTGNELHNILLGNSATNILDGDEGADNLIGCLGDDIYVIDNKDDIVTEQPGEGIDTVEASISYTLGANLENLDLLGDSALSGSGNDLNNTLTGNAANNVLDGGLGADTMTGWLGNDTYIIDASDTIIENVDAGIDTVKTGFDYALGANFENLTLTGTAAINGIGNELDNVIIGNSADNTLTGMTGNDILKGGYGNDTYLFKLGDGQDTIYDSGSYQNELRFGTGISPKDINFSRSGYDLILDIDGTSDRVIIVDWGNKEPIKHVVFADGAVWDQSHIEDRIAQLPPITGTDGDDTLCAWLGMNDILQGRNGNDTLEEGWGTDFHSGPKNNAVLDGGAGDDRIFSGIANNVIIGGTEQDNISVSLWSHSVLLFNLGDGQDYYSLEGEPYDGSRQTLSLGGGASYSNLSFSMINGSSLVLHIGENDRLTFDSLLQKWYQGWNPYSDPQEPDDTNGDGSQDQNDNYFDALDAKSIKTLQIITDTLPGYNPQSPDPLYNKRVQQFDFVKLVEQFYTETYYNQSNTSWDLTPHLAAAALGGSDTLAFGGAMAYQYGIDGSLDELTKEVMQTQLNDAQFGVTAQAIDISRIPSPGSDGMTGGPEADLLQGSLDADTLRGGPGNDIYVVNNLGDVVVENPGQGIDTVKSRVSYTLDANVENLTMIGKSAINGTGNELDNILTGNSAVNVLSGNQGNDTYVVDSADTIIEYAGEGTDTVEAAFDYILGEHLENLTLVGNEGTSASGNDLDNVITGNSTDNTLTGGAGSDQLAGGGGRDVYVFNLGDGKDQVLDAAESGIGNSIKFGSGIEREDIIITQAGNILTIRYGTRGDQVQIAGFDPTGANGSLVVESIELADGRVLSYEDFNHDPEVGDAELSDLTILEGESLYFQLPEDTFRDAEGDTLLYSAEAFGSSVLPDWLHFDPATGIFSGTPGNDDVGSFEIMVSAADTSGASASRSFIISVDDINHAPLLKNKLPDAEAKSGTLFSYTVLSHAFVDPDTDDSFILSATMADGNPLPSWLSFNTATNTFSGTPATPGLVSVRMTATDNGELSASDIFDIVIKPLGLNLTGTAASDTLIGKKGDDLLAGMDGNDSIYGNDGADTLLGGFGNDYLNGGAGADTMAGGPGNDYYTVDNELDIVREDADAGTDSVSSAISYILGENIENLSLSGSAEIDGTGNFLNNTLQGNSAANLLAGLDGNDSIYGNDGADTLLGGFGNDYLNGGAGADIFVFNTALNTKTNKDSISDFTAGVDKIRLDKTIFTSLIDEGTLSSAFFYASSTGLATDANDHFLYNTSTGALLYDLDGNGQGVAVQFATLTSKPTITADDFLVIA